MNKYWYDNGNVFKVKFRRHNCYKCGSYLTITKHYKVVDQKSEEAKYYSFHFYGTHMVGSCEFIHKVFYCSKCSEYIEFVTQVNQEDIDIIINKVIAYLKKRNREILITKSYETNAGEFINKIVDISDVSNLCLTISEKNKETITYKIPLSREELWERPYYFNLKKKRLIDFLEDA